MTRPLARPPQRLTGQQVIAAVSEETGVLVKAILGQRRTQDVIRPRQVAAFLMRRHCPHLSYPAIGLLMGGRDHTTALHAKRKIEALLAVDRELARLVGRIEARLFPIKADALIQVPFNVLCARYAASLQRAAA